MFYTILAVSPWYSGKFRWYQFSRVWDYEVLIFEDRAALHVLSLLHPEW